MKATLTVDKTALPLFAWVSRLDTRPPSIDGINIDQTNADYFAKFDIFDVHLGEGQWLVSIMAPYSSAAKPTHLGSLFLHILAAPGTTSQSVLAPLAYAPPKDPTANYTKCRELDSKLKVNLYCDGCRAHELDLRGTDPHDYTQPTKFTNALASSSDKDKLLGFCRDIMLFFPTLRIPGWGGIPQTVFVGERTALRLFNRVGGVAGGPKTLQKLAGIYTVDPRVRYATEFIDDVSPMQATLFYGDDCDGFSMSAYNLFLSLGALDKTPLTDTPMMVSGFAKLSNGKYGTGAKHTVGHAWVMLRNPTTGVLTMCETTASTTDDSHFETAAFAWSVDACYAFCTKKNHEIFIGVDLTAFPKPLSLEVRTNLSSAADGPFLYRFESELPPNLFHNTHWFKDAPSKNAVSAYVCGTYHDHGGATAASALDKSIIRKAPKN